MRGREWAMSAAVLPTTLAMATCSPDAAVPGAFNDLSDPSSWITCEVGPAEVRMGSAGGQGEYLFFGVTGALFLPDGGMAVLHRSSQEVRLFDEEGRSRGALGRAGDGPGELRDPIALALLGPDSLAVWDWRQGRVTVFALPDGGSRSIRLEPPAVNPTGSFGVVDRGDAARTFLIGSNPTAHFGADRDGGHQSLHVLEYSSEGHLLDTLRILPYGRTLWVDQANREVGQPWFQAQGRFRSRDGLLYTALGDTTEVEVTVLTDTGAPRLVTWVSPDRRVLTEHVQARREETFRRFEGNPYLTERLERVWNTMPIEPRFPAMDAVIPDEAGRIWIREYPRPGQAGQNWWLFDAEGAFRCAARFPDRFEPHDFRGNSVLGVFRDEFDIEVVEVRPIEPPGRGEAE